MTTVSIIAPDVAGLLARFEPIDLAEMDAVALLDRTDTKYVMSASQLARTLAALSDRYRVLDVNGTRLNRYQTLYFDSDDFALYALHHAGRPSRYKIRSREYVDSGISFLEIKWKGARGRTVKNRVRTAGFQTQLTGETAGFLEGRAPIAPQLLAPKLANEFCRITLVDKGLQERVTLDVGLRFSADGQSVELPGIVIAEVKQAGVNRGSAFVREMRASNVHPSGFSKYCIGVSLLYEQVKHNRFKPELLLVSRLMEDCDE